MPALEIIHETNKSSTKSPFSHDHCSTERPTYHETTTTEIPPASISHDTSHQSNVSDDAHGFINDFTSTNEVATLRKIAEETERQLQQERREKEDAEAARIRLNEELATLRQLKLTNQTKISELEGTVTTLKDVKSQLQNANTQIQTVETRFRNMNAEFETTRGELSIVQVKLRNAINATDQAKKPLDNRNNLDPGCHGRLAYIVHITSRVAVDVGGDGGSRILGWGFDMTNPNQKLVFEKTDPSDRFSAWTIRGQGRYLEYRVNSGGDPIYCCSWRRYDGDRQTQEWWIGRDNGGYL